MPKVTRRTKFAVGAADLASVFPRILTSEDLPKLNALLDQVEQGLKAAQRSYMTGEYAGRTGACAALLTVQMLLGHFEMFDGRDLTTPLEALFNALIALNNNNQLPILKPIAKPGSPPPSQIRTLIEGLAVATVDRLLELDQPLDVACKMVADILVQYGVKALKSKKVISERTIKNWKQRAAEDVAMQTMLANMRGIFVSARELLDDPDENPVLLALEQLETALQAYRSSDIA